MDVLRIHKHFNEIREHEHSSRILLNSSTITSLLVSGDEKKNCASGTIGHLKNNSFGGALDIISGSTNSPEIWSGPCIATKRKHEDMNHLGVEIGNTDHPPTSTHNKQPRLRSVVGEYNAAYKSHGISDKMIHGTLLESLSKLPIPEACGDSDLTAEPRMAESSKSSACFDDACTLALDSGVTVAESNTTTGLRQFVEYTKTMVSDLNYPVQIEQQDHEGPGDQMAEQSKDSTTEKFASFTEKLHFNETEDFIQVTNRNPRTPEIMASASEECSMAGIDSQSWLQLGLGTGGAKNRPHLINTEHVLKASEDYNSRVYTGSKTDEEKYLLSLQSKSFLSRKDSPASIYWPDVGSGHGSSTDQASKLTTLIGSNFDKASTETVHESISQGARERGLKLFLVGDKISSVLSHGDSASDYTTGVPRAHTLNSLRSFLQLPAACDQNIPGFVRANPLEQAYQVSLSPDGWTSSSQLLSDHLQLRSMNNRSVQLHPLHDRFGGALPGQREKDATTATGEGGLIQNQRHILSQEWQQVAQRIGTDMHFQSILPGGIVPVGNSNPFQFTIGDMELTAMQRASQIRHPWSDKDFRNPPGNPLGHQIVAGYLSASTSNIPKNHMKSFDNPVNEKISLLPHWQTSVSGSRVPNQSQKIDVARNIAISAETYKLANCTSDHRRRPGLWFMLQASENPSRPTDFTLPQISKGYLRVKDEKVSVSDVKKYLANKLGVACESEVEIFCKGRPLDSSLSLQSVRDRIWFQHESSEETSDRGENNICNVGPSGVFSISNGAIMVLTYQRKISSLSIEIK